MKNPPDRREQTPTPFSALVNYLFATRLSPEGRPYTLREVSDATGGKLSSPYLSYLRTGKIANPPADRVQLLADVFGVDVGYFTGKYSAPHAPVSTTDEELWEALSKPLVREVAKRAARVSPGERALILEMLERAEQLATAAQALEAGASSTDASTERQGGETPPHNAPFEEEL